MNWSHFQTDIFHAVADTSDSLLIEAVAGSGKTSTIVEAINYVPAGQTVCFVAFNKSIADELQRRVTRPGARCMTLHSAGWQAWKRSLGWDENLCKVDTNKTFTIMKELMSWKERERCGETTRRLVGYGKQMGIVPRNMYLDTHLGEVVEPFMENALVMDTDKAWESLSDHYGIDFDEVNLELVRKVLARGIETAREQCDFDDMLAMPIIAGVEFDKYDIVFVDETQDLSTIQMEMISRMVKSRVIAVGDRAQSIYQWRGAHSGAMDELRDRFHMRELPLSISYRCPKSVVQKAKRWVPQIESHDEAVDGFVGEEGTDWKGQAAMALGAAEETIKKFDEMFPTARGQHDAVVTDFSGQEYTLDFVTTSNYATSYGMSKEKLWPEGISKWTSLRDFTSGDVILCRLTRPLVAAAFALIRARIPARVLGRDIGQGLTKLIERVLRKARAGAGMALPAFDDALGEYLAAQRARLAEKGKKAEIGRLEDQVATVAAFIDGMEAGNGRHHRVGNIDNLDHPEADTLTVADLTSEIERLFSDNAGGGVTLSTIHKFKGMEASRVFVLDAGALMPWKWASQDWELQSERNLMYVACTRAKRELRYITYQELLGHE